MESTRERRRAGGAASALLRVLYWLVVLAVSLVLVYLLIGWLEARDNSSLDAATRPQGTWGTT